MFSVALPPLDFASWLLHVPRATHACGGEGAGRRRGVIINLLSSPSTPSRAVVFVPCLYSVVVDVVVIYLVSWAGRTQAWYAYHHVLRSPASARVRFFFLDRRDFLPLSLFVRTVRHRTPDDPGLFRLLKVDFVIFCISVEVCIDRASALFFS